MKKKFQKLLIGLVLVLLLVVFVAPAGVGMLAEGRYKQVWRDMLAAEPGLSAEVTAFERGWFRSNAEVTVTVTDASLAPMLIEMGWAESRDDGRRALVHLREGIHHGPVPFTAPAPLTQRWRPGFAVIDSRMEENLPLVAEHGIDIQHTVHMSLMGALSGHLRVEPFNLKLEEEEVAFRSRDTVQADWQSDRRMDRVDMRMWAGELRMDAAQGASLKIENPWLEVNQRRGPADLWLGGSEFRLDAMEMKLPGEGQNRLEDMVWATNTGERDGMIEQAHEVRIDAMVMNGMPAGPADLEMNFYRFHPQALSDLQQALSGWEGFDEEATVEGDALFAELREPLIALALHQPGLRLDRFSLALPGGAIDGDGHVELVEMDRETLESRLESDQFMQMIQGEARFAAGRNLARRALAMSMLGHLPEGQMEQDMIDLLDMQLNSAVAEGILSETEDGFEVRFKIENGVFEVNDREMLRF